MSESVTKFIVTPNELSDVVVPIEHYELPYLPSFMTKYNGEIVIKKEKAIYVETKRKQSPFTLFVDRINNDNKYYWYRVILNGNYVNNLPDLIKIIVNSYKSTLEDNGLNKDDIKIRIKEFEPICRKFVNNILTDRLCAKYMTTLLYYMHYERDNHISKTLVMQLMTKFSNGNAKDLTSNDTNLLGSTDRNRRKNESINIEDDETNEVNNIIGDSLEDLKDE